MTKIEESARTMLPCDWCARAFAVNKCGQCENRFYCSDACQELDWYDDEHHKECDKIGFRLLSEGKRNAVPLTNAYMSSLIPTIFDENQVPFFLYPAPLYDVGERRPIAADKTGVYLYMDPAQVGNQEAVPKSVWDRFGRLLNLNRNAEIYLRKYLVKAAKTEASKAERTELVKMKTSEGEGEAAIQYVLNLPNKMEAANILARLRARVQSLFRGLDLQIAQRYDQEFTPQHIESFVTRTSEQTKWVEQFPDIKTLAFNRGAGRMLSITLRSPTDTNVNFIKDDPVYYVTLHELSHTLAPTQTEFRNVFGKRRIVRDMHGARFKHALKYLLEESTRLGIINVPTMSANEFNKFIKQTHSGVYPENYRRASEDMMDVVAVDEDDDEDSSSSTTGPSSPPIRQTVPQTVPTKKRKRRAETAEQEGGEKRVKPATSATSQSTIIEPIPRSVRAIPGIGAVSAKLLKANRRWHRDPRDPFTTWSVINVYTDAGRNPLAFEPLYREAVAGNDRLVKSADENLTSIIEWIMRALHTISLWKDEHPDTLAYDPLRKHSGHIIDIPGIGSGSVRALENAGFANAYEVLDADVKDVVRRVRASGGSQKVIEVLKKALE